jgi:hypothetical protein
MTQQQVHATAGALEHQHPQRMLMISFRRSIVEYASTNAHAAGTSATSRDNSSRCMKQQCIEHQLSGGQHALFTQQPACQQNASMNACFTASLLSGMLSSDPTASQHPKMRHRQKSLLAS